MAQMRAEHDEGFQATILTLFPDMFPATLGLSLLRGARLKMAYGLWMSKISETMPQTSIAR